MRDGAPTRSLWLSLLCSVIMAGLPPLARGENVESFAKIVAPLLKQHCFECHGPDLQEARIQFDRLQGFETSDHHLWTSVYDQVSRGLMPPAGQPTLAAAEKKQLLEALAEAQRREPGLRTRRLNRRELTAALRDVSGLMVDYSYSLPEDGKVDGFDTGAEALQDAADSVADLMRATRRTVEGMRFLEPAQGKVFAADVREAKDVRKVFDAWKADGLSGGGDVQPVVGTGWLLKPKWLGDRGGMTIRMPPPENRTSILRLQLTVAVQKSLPAIPNPHLWIEVGGRELAPIEISNASDQPRTLDYQIQLSDVNIDAKGLSITLSNRVEMPYAIAGFENEEKTKPGEMLPGGTGLFRPLFDSKTLPLAEQPVPFIVLQSFEIESNYRAVWPPAAWKQSLTASDDRASAEKLLTLWMERAWRRPIEAAEPARFLKLYDELRQQGNAYDEALRAAFQGVLLAGSFRFLNSPQELESQKHQALAARLSFMLWGTPADEELRQLAAAGTLTEPRLMKAQTARLLADPRREGFVRPFVTQWLELGQPITLAMDHLQKQDFRFGRHLKASLQEETIRYVEQMLIDNRPAAELFASDWTMMNNIVARHYGYEGIEGANMRKVKLRPDDPRGGGILSQAGIQSMLCWMGDNWVIYRGAWTLRRLLDDPPPPAPLEVPELLPSDAKNQGKTFRELLKQHQEDSKCSVCHKAMDPLGFAFQNFDLSGRWRDREYEKYVRSEIDGKIAWQGAGKDRPVDAAGQLPRGEKFSSYAECRQQLAAHYTEDLVRGFMKNLVLYGTGRKANIDDLIEIRRIMTELQPRGYPLRDVVQALVCSPVFAK